MREELLKIVLVPPTPPPKAAASKPRAADRIEAAKNVVMMDLALLNAEIADGMYKRPIADIAKQFQYEPLPDEVRVAVIAAWQRGGLLPRDAIERMLPAART
jgi:hypothetical protein